MGDISIGAIAREIEQRASGLGVLLGGGQVHELERLRDETANLQALIAEATRLRRMERRAFARGAALLTPVVIEASGFTGFCLVDNLSPHGMSAKAYTTLPSGHGVKVHFSSDQSAEGRLVWASDERVGIEFDAPLSLPRVLSRKQANGKPKRPARLAVCGEIEMTAGSAQLAAEVLDVSQHGLKVAGSALSEGEQVSVLIEGLDAKAARVRWNRGGTAGLKLLRPLTFAELGRLGR